MTQKQTRKQIFTLSRATQAKPILLPVPARHLSSYTNLSEEFLNALTRCCHCISRNTTNFGEEAEDHIVCCTLRGNGVSPFSCLLGGAAAQAVQAPAKERPGKAGLRHAALLSCSASPSLATNQQKILPPWKTAGWGSAKPKSHFGFTVGSHQGLEELPRYIPGTVRTGAIKQPKVTGEKAAFAQGFAVCARLCSALILRSTSPQTGGTPDSLPITVISHPYTWLRSAEKETGLIFRYFMASYSCWQSELQIFFLRGPFAPYAFVFSALSPATTHAGSLRGCRRDTGHRGSSIPHHAALLKHFVPFPRSRGQTDIAQF